MTATLFTLCFVSCIPLYVSPHPPLLRHTSLDLANGRSTSAWRQRHTRAARRVPSVPPTQLIARRRRRDWLLTARPGCLQHAALSCTLQSFVPLVLSSPKKPVAQPQLRLTAGLLPTPGAHNSMDEPTPSRPGHLGHSRSLSGAKGNGPRPPRSDTMPPQPAPMDECFDSPPPSCGSRSTRSHSTASRNSNRLSLTLPIALPHGPPRLAPISTAVPSLPPTPGATPVTRSPKDANDFIHAIATQERRVLEIREELKAAETELSRLKRQWGAFDSVRKRNSMVNGVPLRPTISLHNAPNVDDVEGTRRSVELDRRRSLLMNQRLNTEICSPVSGRPRRVLRGGHTRALSLLSPTKPAGGFSILDDASSGHTPPAKHSEPHFENLTRQPLAANGVSKRATWTPQSSSTSPSNAVMKQMAEDFKSGLWTFVEDLRQAAVGNEPIVGGSTTGRRVSSRPSENDRDTIRASVSSSRPHLANAFKRTDQTPTPSSRSALPLKDCGTANMGRPKTVNSKRTKHFSWTPLTVDSFDDSDWSNWDSPPTVPSPRWSGSTAQGDLGSTAIPEKGDENDPSALQNLLATVSARAPRDREPASSPLSSLKLEELLPMTVFNKLSPSNLARATSEFMVEWERSLGQPERKNKSC